MSNVVPQLVYDRDTGKICIMIKLGGEAAVQALPDELSTATEDEVRSYLDGIVPTMIDGLRAKQTEKRQAIYKKAKNA